MDVVSGNIVVDVVELAVTSEPQSRDLLRVGSNHLRDYFFAKWFEPTLNKSHELWFAQTTTHQPQPPRLQPQGRSAAAGEGRAQRVGLESRYATCLEPLVCVFSFLFSFFILNGYFFYRCHHQYPPVTEWGLRHVVS